MITQDKRCCDCKYTKPLEAFANSSCRKSGKQDCCRVCMSSRAKARRARLKQKGVTPVKSKYCPKCDTIKNGADFYPSISKPAGVQDYCKICQNEISMAYMKAHPEQTYEHNKAYRKRNPDKVSDWDRTAKIKRHRLLANAECDSGITLDSLYTRDGGICGICSLLCDREDASIDHICPLSKGGDHIWNNIQLAHHKCNSSKGNIYENRA